MRVLLSGFIVGILFLSGCQFPMKKASPEIQLNTQMEKVSYSIGMSVGSNLKQQDFELTADLVAAGLKDSLSGTPKLTEQEMRDILTVFEKEQKEIQEKKQAELGAKNKTAEEEFLAKNKNKDGVITLDSGLQYEILEKGKGTVSPKATDFVKVDYKGSLLDGSVFDSSIERGQPATFQVNRVIPGWTEAMQLMKPGDKWMLYIPSKLAYGPRQVGPKIGPNATLIFEVKLLSIEEEPKK